MRDLAGIICSANEEGTEAMNLKIVREILEEVGALSGIDVGLHGISRNTERACAIFPRARAGARESVVGGRGNIGFDLARVTMLLRWGRDGDMALEMAQSVYDEVAEKRFNYAGRDGFFSGVNSGPVWLGMDGRGVFEYVLDFDVYLEAA